MTSRCDENCEGENMKSCRYDASDWDSVSHSLSIKVEYHRTLEYNLRWKGSMSSRHSPRLSKASKTNGQKSPSPKDEVTQSKPRGRRRRELKEADHCGVDENGGNERDILDLILEEEPVHVVHNGLDESDEDLSSDCSSVASGPSISHHASTKKPKSSQALCAACCELYQRAKKIKAPVMSKLLDTDPESLTCDQWILIKKWTPRNLPDEKRKLLSCVQFDKMISLKRRQRPVGSGESLACSRPHTFLLRNLRRVRLAERKGRNKKRRKRRRADSQGSRAAKQQRLLSDAHLQRNVRTCKVDKSKSHKSSGKPGSSKMANRADPDVTDELIPPSVAIETTKSAKPTEVYSKQKTPKKTREFKDLLAQLQGNISKIVRETR